MAKKRGHGEGSIYQMADGRWRGAITVGYRQNETGGVSQVRKMVSGDTRSDVATKMKRLLVDQQKGMNISPEKMRLEDLMSRWLEHVVRPSLSCKTHRTYTDLTRIHVTPRLGKTQLSALTTLQIQAFLNEKHADGLSPKTVKQIRDCLRATLNVAVEDWEALSRNRRARRVHRSHRGER